MTRLCLQATHRSRAQASTTHTTIIKARRESERAQGRDAAAHWYCVYHLVYNIYIIYYIALFSPFLICHQNTALGTRISNERCQNKSYHCTWAHSGLCSFMSSLILSQNQWKLGAKGEYLIASTLVQGLQLCDLTLLVSTDLIIF